MIHNERLLTPLHAWHYLYTNDEGYSACAWIYVIYLKCDVNDGGQVCCEGNYDDRREQKVTKNCKRNTTFE